MRNGIIKIAAASLMIAAVLQANTSVGQVTSGQLNTITTAVPFLMIAPDARAGAMGDVGVATSPDANNIHWNPSKLAFVEDDMALSLSYTPWLRALVPDINLAYLSFHKRLDKKNMQTLGASLLYFNLGDITFTDQNGNVIGQFRPNEFALDLAYGRKLSDRISGGMALRFIYSNLTGGINVQGADTKAGTSVAGDVSVFYQNDDIRISKKDAVFTWGINISNIGAKIGYTETSEKDFIPINLRLGTGLKLDLDDYNSMALYVDFNKLMVPTPPVYQRDSLNNPVYDDQGNLIVELGRSPDVGVVSGMFGSFSDAPGGFSEELKEFTYSVGMEYWYDKQFAVRAGYFHEHATKGNRKFFTLGAGLRYNVFGLDFAYLIPTQQRHPLENTLRFTLTFGFDAFKKQQSDDSGE